MKILKIFLSLLFCFSFALADDLNSTLNEEFKKLIFCVKDNDTKCVKELSAKTPELINFKTKESLFLKTMIVDLSSYDNYAFNEEMFDLLVNLGYSLNNVKLAFYVIYNRAISDEKTALILKKMKEQGLDFSSKFARISIPQGLDMESFANSKIKTFEYAIKNGAKSYLVRYGTNRNYGLNIVNLNISSYFYENNASSTIVDERSAKFMKTKSYDDFIKKQFELLKIYLVNGGEILEEGKQMLEDFFIKHNDTKNLEILKNLLKKENK